MVRTPRPPMLVMVLTSIALVAALTRVARAGNSVRLAYVRGDGAEQCADEKGLRLSVAVRLGYDPFVAWAPKTVHADVARDGARLRARVYLAGEDGRAQGTRVLFAPLDDCGKLLAAVALAISIAVDPMSTGVPDAAPAVEGKETETSREAIGAPRDDRSNATPSAPTSDTRPSPILEAQSSPTSDRGPAAATPRGEAPTSRFDGSGGLGTVLAVGTSPNVAAGFAGFFRVGWNAASLAIEGRYHLPDSRSAEVVRGTVETTLLVVSLEPCIRFSPFSLCGLATIGSLHGAGDGIAQPLEGSTLYWGAGGRGVIEVALVAPLSLRGHVDLVANGTRIALAIDDREIWRVSALSAAAGIDILMRFW